MPIRIMLMIGTLLRITPSSVHRHFVTLRDASNLAASISDAEGVCVIEAMCDVYGVVTEPPLP